MLKDYTLNKADNQNWLKTIGIFQIAGGTLGLILLLYAVISSGLTLMRLTTVLGLLLFGLSIFAGVLTFKLAENSLKWTTLNQFLQIFSVFAGNFSFQYISGASVDVGLDLSNFTFGINFNLSSLTWSIANETQNYYFGFNIIAIFIIYKIEKIKNDIKTKKELQESLQKHNA